MKNQTLFIFIIISRPCPIWFFFGRALFQHLPLFLHTES
jgi:hypothetical protein